MISVCIFLMNYQWVFEAKLNIFVTVRWISNANIDINRQSCTPFQRPIQDFRNGERENERWRRKKFLGRSGDILPREIFEFLSIWSAISSILRVVLNEILRKYLVIKNTILVEKWSTSQCLYSISLSKILFWSQTVIINETFIFFAILVDLPLPAGKHSQFRLQKTCFRNWG